MVVNKYKKLKKQGMPKTYCDKKKPAPKGRLFNFFSSYGLRKFISAYHAYIYHRIFCRSCCSFCP